MKLKENKTKRSFKIMGKILSSFFILNSIIGSHSVCEKLEITGENLGRATFITSQGLVSVWNYRADINEWERE